MHDRINHQQLCWLPELTAAVRRELSKLSKGQDDRRPALEQEIKGLDEKIAGWSESLANPNLPSALRLAIETQWSSALERKQEIGSA